MSNQGKKCIKNMSNTFETIKFKESLSKNLLVKDQKPAQEYLY